MGGDGSDDLRRAVLKTLDSCAAVTLRDHGGVYWVPAPHAETLRKLQGAISMIGASRLDVVPIHATPEATAALGTAARASIEEELAGLPAPPDPFRAVYILHGPPSGMGLDVVRGGARVGSPATRTFIERVRPRLTLHGHIHESPEESGTWRGTLGETVCLQPGQSASGLSVVIGRLDGMTFERKILPPT